MTDKERRFRLVFWAEDCDTGEVIGEKSELMGVISPADLKKAVDQVDSAFPDATEEDLKPLRRHACHNIVAEVVSACCITVMRGLQMKIRERLNL